MAEEDARSKKEDFDLWIKINQALQSSEYFVDWDWAWLEAISGQQILVAGIIDNTLVYIALAWDTDALGNIVFSDFEEIVVEAMKNEKVNMPMTRVFNEALVASIELDQKNERCKSRRGRVKKAQVAEQINKNKRLYPKSVLAEAVKEMQENIVKNGALHMDTQHRIRENMNYRDIRETVGLIDKVDFDGETVSLEFITVDTQAGRDFLALVDAGAKFQVSQRGLGKSHFQKIGDELIEVVDELHIEGFDFLPSGTASVEGADVEFLEGKEKMEKELDVIKEKMERELDLINEKVTERLAEIRKKELLEKALQNKEKFLSEEFSLPKYDFLSEAQKKVIAEKIKVDELVELDEKAFSERLRESLEEEVNTAMKLLAENELGKMGYKKESVVKGRTVEVVENAKPWLELVDKLYPDVEKVIKRQKPANSVYISDSHSANKIITAMCEKFEETNYQKLMNEAGEEVTQSDIGVKVATLSRTIIPAVFRFITAFDVCDVNVMANRIENVMYSVWNGNYTAGQPHTSVGAIEISEGGTIATAGISYASCPILANRKTLRTKISSEAIATAKNTPMNPVADTLAYLALDVSQRIDELLWYLMIAQAQKQAYGEVTNWETLTKKSTTVYASAKYGWIQYEYVKAFDTNGNPSSAKLIPLFGSTSGNTLQAVTVRHSGNGGTALTYGTHYTINYPDGSITLTPAGVTEVGNNSVQAKYSYTTNMSTWSVIPPDGVSGYENLVNLRQAVGRARVKVGNRHYTPNVLGLSLNSEDRISSSPMFTQAGSTPSDILDRLNKVVSYAGLEPVRTSAMPDGWLLVFERGACIYRNHTPWHLYEPIRDVVTGDEYWIGEEYSGQDVPVKDKLSLVAILDLDSEI